MSKKTYLVKQSRHNTIVISAIIKETDVPRSMICFSKAI